MKILLKMSGIVGIVNLDGALVDRRLLAQMTNFMTNRGPDAQQIHIDGPVGLGHTMLRTTLEANSESQPLTVDRNVVLTADARIDGRNDLIAELKAKFGPHFIDESSGAVNSPAQLTDAHLILYAYKAWGSGCVSHLIGDFAFAIWDGVERRLFCARDHFGVKPFYYARSSKYLLFSNSLNCLRQHPSVSSTLNERAVGDFLLFEMNYDLSTTVFADIQRLPPGHTLTCEFDGTVKVQRYWSLPSGGRIRYAKASDYVEHFKDLMDAATGDRLRTDRIGIFMSGGLDSTSIAATAKSLLSSQSDSFDLQAYTIVYDSLIPDNEREYAELVSQSLGIQLNLLCGDEYRLFERSDEHQMWRPEPIPNPFMSLASDYYEQISRNCRVVLSGQGPDAVLSTHFAKHTTALIRQRRPLSLIGDLCGYVFWNRRLPAIGVRTLLRRLLNGNSIRSASFPPWLSKDFVKRLDLVKRFDEINAEPLAFSDTRHPVGHEVLSRRFWTYLFERDDADLSQRAIEPRYPFFDVRVVSFLLSIPVMRWCVDKKLLRQAMQGRLPDAVRLRPKTPLAGDILQARLQRGDRLLNLSMASLPELEKYVIPPDDLLIDFENTSELWSNLRVQVFHDWMLHTLGAKNEFRENDFHRSERQENLHHASTSRVR